MNPDATPQAIVRGPGRGRYDRSKSAAQRRQERHVRMLLAAADTFAARGSAQVSISDIVEAAGVSRKTFYEHFVDVLDCLFQLYDFGVNQLAREIERAIVDIDDPVDRVRVGLSTYLTGMGRTPRLTLVLNRGTLTAGSEYFPRREASYGRWVTILMQGLAQAHAQGIITRLPDETTLYTLVTGTEALALRTVERGDADRITDAVPGLVELYFRALGADPERIRVC